MHHGTKGNGRFLLDVHRNGDSCAFRRAIADELSRETHEKREAEKKKDCLGHGYFRAEEIFTRSQR